MMKMLSALLLFMSVSFSLFSQQFYVSPTGDDTDPGTFEEPWLTIQHACETATAGSTVYIFAGTYEEQLNMEVSGAEGAFITFTSYNNEEVIIDGGATGSQTVLLNIEDQSYIRIDGLKFTNAVGNFSIGIIVQGSSSNIQILNNDISGINFSANFMDVPTSSDNTNPLVIYGNDELSMEPGDALLAISGILINGNSIHDCRTGFSEGLTVNGNVDGFDIIGNTVFNISNIGIDAAGGYNVSPPGGTDFARNGTILANTVFNCKTPSPLPVAAGIYVDGGQNILIEHNIVHDCGRGYEIGCEQQDAETFGITLRNNIAYRNTHAGIGIGGYNYSDDPMDPGTTGKVVACEVLNNTCYDNSQILLGEGELYVEYTEDCVIKNNIFYGTGVTLRLFSVLLNAAGDPSVNLILDYNIYYHSLGIAATVTVDYNGEELLYSDFLSDEMQDEHSLFADPKFVDVSVHDFHLGALSPAFDAGDPLLLPEMGERDIDDQDRLQFDAVDIGADEAAINLPVEYSHPLSARAIQSGIELRWSTGIEHNAAQFEIQRSADGSVFEKTDAVPAKGSNSDYAFLDRNPVTGSNYYRLKQIDLDGRSKLSNVAMVKWEAGVITGVFPNPAADHFEIRNNTGAWEKAVLRNALGQTIRTFSTGQETTLGGLEKGVYRLEVFVTEEAQPQVFSLVKS